ncbi:hypothetical protein LS48_14815, partial [Aequorivita aquimaris]
MPDRAQNVAEVDGGYNSVTIAIRRARPASPPPARAIIPTAPASPPRQQYRAATDLNAKQFIRLATQVAAAMKAGLAMQLVCGEIEIAIGADRQGIGPADARIADQGRPLAAIEHPDRIVFVITGEDTPTIILGNAIRRALAPQATNRTPKLLFRHRRIAQHRRGHGMQGAARERPIVEHAAIGARRDRVAGDGDRRRRPVGWAVHQH